LVGLDHIAIWTRHRDRLLQAIATSADLRILDGYAPDGAPTARGVRLSNRTFLDIHQIADVRDAAAPTFHRLLALSGDIDDIGRRAAAVGLRSKAIRRRDSPQPEMEAPWDILAFRKGQGVASEMFAIAYHEGVATPAAYAQPLYDPAGPASGDARLARVWLPCEAPAKAGAFFAALGATATGAVTSPVSPYAGVGFAFGSVELILSPPWGEPGALRLDFQGDGLKPAVLAPLPQVTLVMVGPG